MGIFGLKTWDPPRPLPAHMTSGLAPSRIVPEKAAVPVHSKGWSYYHEHFCLLDL